jgi:hypothetical protein
MSLPSVLYYQFIGEYCVLQLHMLYNVSNDSGEGFLMYRGERDGSGVSAKYLFLGVVVDFVINDVGNFLPV